MNLLTRLWRAIVTEFIVLEWRWDSWQKRRANQRQLALQLHQSTAWHCGCVVCRELKRDGGKVYGRVETIQLSPEERAKLRGES